MSRVDLFSLITQFTRSTDTRRSSRAHRGVRGALVPGLVTESRADGLESRRLCGPGGYHAKSTHAAELIALSFAADEGVWLRRLLLEIGFVVPHVCRVVPANEANEGCAMSELESGSLVVQRCL